MLTTIGILQSSTILAGLQLWLDASDSSLVTIATGVSQWNDKSGNERHAVQATTANQPSYQTAVQNGLNTIRFDGSNDFFTVGSTADWTFMHSEEASVYIITKIGVSSDPNALYVLLANNGLTTASTGYSLHYDDRVSVPRNNAIVNFVTKSVSGDLPISNIASNYYTPNSFKLLSCFTILSALDDARSHIQTNNGAVQSNNTSNITPVLTNATHNLNIGQSGVNSGFLSGDIGEILIYNVRHSDSERNIISSYLMNKWGL